MLLWFLQLFCERAAAERDRRAHARAMYIKYMAARRGQ